MRQHVFSRTGLAPALVVAALLSACDSKPPTWEALLAARITQEFPGYSVNTAAGQLLVDRPGLASKTVDVNDIAQFCRRGPRDCEYAKDQMVIDLRAPLPATLAPPLMPASRAASTALPTTSRPRVAMD